MSPKRLRHANRCAVPECKAPAGPNLLFCWPHYKLLPRAQQRQLRVFTIKKSQAGSAEHVALAAGARALVTSLVAMREKP